MTDKAPDPRSGGPHGRTWVRRSGADRRRRLRATLDVVRGEGVVVLDDRRLPGAWATLPVIAVAPAGVFVIDTRHHKGLVHTKRPGPVDRLDRPELHVGRTDCTPVLEDLCRQVEIVRSTLRHAPGDGDVPVTAVLCLTRAEWGLATAARVRDVWVGWPRLLADTLRSPGVFDPPTVHLVADALDTGLPTR